MASTRDLQTLDEIWGKLTLAAGYLPTVPLSNMIQAEGGGGSAINAKTITLTNDTDASSVTLGMSFGFGYLTIDPANAGGFGGLSITGSLFFTGDISLTTGDSAGVGSAALSWQSGQSLNEGANGSLGSQYLYTVSSFQIGYTGGGTASRKLFFEAGTGNVTSQGKVMAVGGLGVGNSASASVIPNSGLVKKIQIFDASGNSLGFIPVYSSIT